jgi:hypothetical protein
MVEAAVDLAAQGFRVSASGIEGSPLHRRLHDLETHGVELWPRPLSYSLRRQPWDRLVCGSKHPATFALERKSAETWHDTKPHQTTTSITYRPTPLKL